MVDFFLGSPLLGVAMTLVVYWLAQILYGRLKHVLFNPVALSIATIILLLGWLEIPFESYRKGGDLILFLLGPAVVALAVPLYERREEIFRYRLPIAAGICCGSVASILSATLLAWACGGNRELVLSMAPKSVTAPIAIGIVESIGGIAPLAAAVVVLTGCLGAVIGPEFCRLVGIKDPLPMGIAMGTAAHGIGTARMMEEDSFAGALSGLAIGLNGLVTSGILSALFWIFG